MPDAGNLKSVQKYKIYPINVKASISFRVYFLHIIWKRDLRFHHHARGRSPLVPQITTPSFQSHYLNKRQRLANEGLVNLKGYTERELDSPASLTRCYPLHESLFDL